jgi:hypothetical protein
MTAKLTRQRERDRLLLDYDAALERGDFAAVAAALEQAQGNALLEEMILELHADEWSETDATAEQGAAEVVRELLRKCLPSGFAAEDDTAEPPPLTVGDVIGHLQPDAAYKALAAREGQAAVERLRQSGELLPADLSPRGVRRFFERLGLPLGEAFQKLFREAAFFLEMGRERQREQLAAARRQRQPRRPAPRREKQEP